MILAVNNKMIVSNDLIVDDKNYKQIINSIDLDAKNMYDSLTTKDVLKSIYST